MEISAAVAGLFGALIGALASVVTTYINVKNTAKVQQDLERLKRDFSTKDFQREALIKVQKDLQTCMRLNSQIYIKCFFKREDNADFWNIKLPKEDDDLLSATVRDLRVYNERLTNSSLRKSIYALQENIMRSIDFVSSKKETQKKLYRLQDGYNVVLTKIGEEIRKTY